MTVREIIDTARRRHPAFTEQRIPTKTMLPVLSDLHRVFVEKTVAIDADAINTDLEVELPLADFDAGYALPDHHLIRAVAGGTSDGRSVPIDIIPSAHRNARNRPAAAAWIVGGKLFLSGTAASWSGYSELAVGYVPVPEDFDTETSLDDQELVLPVTARTAIADALALYMAKRIGKLPADVAPIDVREFKQDAKDSLLNYEIGLRTKAGSQVFRIMDTFP